MRKDDLNYTPPDRLEGKQRMENMVPLCHFPIQEDCLPRPAGYNPAFENTLR